MSSTIRDDIYQLLSTSPDIKNIAKNIYPYAPEQNAKRPFVMYTIADGESDTTLTGATGIFVYSVTIEGWANTIEDQESLHNTLISLLHGWNVGNSGNIMLSKLTAANRDNMLSEDGEEDYFVGQSYRVITR